MPSPVPRPETECLISILQAASNGPIFKSIFTLGSTGWGPLSFFSMRIKAFLSGNKGSYLKREAITTTNSRVMSLKKRVHLHCKHWGWEKSCNKHRICRLSRSNTMAGKWLSVSVCQGEWTRLNKNVARIKPWNQPATSNYQAKPPPPCSKQTAT